MVKSTAVPHILELAPSARAKCRGCGLAIAKGELRFGERLPNPFADGEGVEMTHWFHMPCVAFRRPEAFLAALPEATAAIDRKDELVHEAELGVTYRRLPRVSTAERASTGRAACRACKEPIPKDSWRIALVYYEEGRFTPSGFVHVACVPSYCETTLVMPRIRHFSPALSDADAAEIAQAIGQA
jgi:hypothetical protein